MLQAYVAAKLGPWLQQTLRVEIVKLDKFARATQNFRRDTAADQRKLLEVLRECCLKVKDGLRVLPVSVRELLSDLYRRVASEVPSELGTLDNMVRSTIFLRCVCRAIRGPEMYGILPATPVPETQTWLLQLATAFKHIVFQTKHKGDTSWEGKLMEFTAHQAASLHAAMETVIREPAISSANVAEGEAGSADTPAKSGSSSATASGKKKGGRKGRSKSAALAHQSRANMLMESAVGTSLPLSFAIATQELCHNSELLATATARLVDDEGQPTQANHDMTAFLERLNPMRERLRELLAAAQLKPEGAVESDGSGESRAAVDGNAAEGHESQVAVTSGEGSSGEASDAPAFVRGASAPPPKTLAALQTRGAESEPAPSLPRTSQSEGASGDITSPQNSTGPSSDPLTSPFRHGWPGAAVGPKPGLGHGPERGIAGSGSASLLERTTAAFEKEPLSPSSLSAPGLRLRSSGDEFEGGTEGEVPTEDGIVVTEEEEDNWSIAASGDPTAVAADLLAEEQVSLQLSPDGALPPMVFHDCDTVSEGAAESPVVASGVQQLTLPQPARPNTPRLSVAAGGDRRSSAGSTSPGEAVTSPGATTYIR